MQIIRVGRVWAYGFGRFDDRGGNNMTATNKIFCRLLTILAGLSLSLTATAADEPEQLLDEIIVTAQKRAENVQNVPIAISTIDGATLEAARIYEFSDLVGRVRQSTIDHPWPMSRSGRR